MTDNDDPGYGPLTEPEGYLDEAETACVINALHAHQPHASADADAAVIRWASEVRLANLLLEMVLAGTLRLGTHPDGVTFHPIACSNAEKMIDSVFTDA